MFDTAFIYAGGYTEKLFGEWHKSRGVREDAVLIGKGAHSPLVYPDVISKQLTQSLDRLQTDYVDVYFMHRDNLDVPVGEFVDAMDAEVKKGRIRGPFGGSNWTKERFDEAIAYADKHGKQRPGALSNNFALAEMLDPIWAGCVTASTDDWKQWLKDRPDPELLAGRARPAASSPTAPAATSATTRSWSASGTTTETSPAATAPWNWRQSSARTRSTWPCAYVLAQDFPSVPLIGPRTLNELDDSMNAFDIKLTPEQVKWLEA